MPVLSPRHACPECESLTTFGRLNAEGRQRRSGRAAPFLSSERSDVSRDVSNARRIDCQLMASADSHWRFNRRRAAIGGACGEAQAHAKPLVASTENLI